MWRDVAAPQAVEGMRMCKLRGGKQSVTSSNAIKLRSTSTVGKRSTSTKRQLGRTHDHLDSRSVNEEEQDMPEKDNTEGEASVIAKLIARVKQARAGAESVPEEHNVSAHNAGIDVKSTRGGAQTSEREDSQMQPSTAGGTAPPEQKGQSAAGGEKPEEEYQKEPGFEAAQALHGWLLRRCKERLDPSDKRTAEGTLRQRFMRALDDAYELAKEQVTAQDGCKAANEDEDAPLSRKIGENAQAIHAYDGRERAKSPATEEEIAINTGMGLKRTMNANEHTAEERNTVIFRQDDDNDELPSRSDEFRHAFTDPDSFGENFDFFEAMEDSFAFLPGINFSMPEPGSWRTNDDRSTDIDGGGLQHSGSPCQDEGQHMMFQHSAWQHNMDGSFNADKPDSIEQALAGDLEAAGTPMPERAESEPLQQSPSSLSPWTSTRGEYWSPSL